MKIMAYLEKEPEHTNCLTFLLKRLKNGQLGWVWIGWRSHKKCEKMGYLKLAAEERLAISDDHFGYILPFQEGDIESLI